MGRCTCIKYEFFRQTRVLGLICTKRQSQSCDNSAMTLAILFSLKTMELLEDGLHPQSGVTPFPVVINAVSADFGNSHFFQLEQYL